MKIAYLYYDFLNLYGESGNIKIISKVLIVSILVLMYLHTMN